MDLDDVRTPGGIGVPGTSLTWRFTRSSAPGGQHVNTSSTRAELRCDLTQLQAAPAIVARVRDRLGDELRVASQAERSQLRNRSRALGQLLERLDEAAAVDPARTATRPTRGSVRRRIEAKQQRSARKADRRWRPDD